MSELSESENEIDYIEQAWNIGRSVLIPDKSRKRYENTYKIFKDWCTKKNTNICEKSLLAYFVGRNEKLKAPGSLWAEYSMLKSTIFLHDSIDISKFLMLIAFLKKKNIGYRPKKASVFTKQEFIKFLLEAPDNKFLAHKVGMILGIAGACRREELYNMRMEDIEERDELIIVKLPQTKTYIQRSFVVINEPNEKVHYLDIYHKYTNLRPKNTKSSHFFLNYRNGKCTNQVIGKGTIGAWPCKIAEYLKLSNPAGYTGHAFRRSSATLLANKGEDLLGLKRHGGWKSSSTAEGYIEDSVENKIKFASKILHGVENKNHSKPSTSMNKQEDKENLICENFDSIDVETSPQRLLNCKSKEDHPQDSVIFSDGANTLSSTSVVKNELPLTIGSCNSCIFNIYVNK